MTHAEFHSLHVGDKVKFNSSTGHSYTIESRDSLYGSVMFHCKEYKNIRRQLCNTRAMCGCEVVAGDRTDYRNWRLAGTPKKHGESCGVYYGDRNTCTCS